LPVVTICDIWFQNTAIGIPLFLIMADMNILVRASQSVLVYNHKNRQQHALVSEYCITAPIILPILPYQRREITRVKRYYQDVIPRYMPDEFRSHFRYLKTFVRELQIVQHLENQLVQH
jgi:hypothetical protein